MAFRPYTNEELRSAAQAYGLDPSFVEAVYAVESSRGTDPQAMKPRTVKRRRDSTIVRGPFQLEDDTTADLIRKHKLGNVNVNDPDVHLDLALRLMSDLKDRYDGDYGKVAQAYLGGPGSVGTNNRDELGTTPGKYARRVFSEMDAINANAGPELLAGPGSGAAPRALPQLTAPESSGSDPLRDLMPFMNTASAGDDDMFGMGGMSFNGNIDPDRASWSDFIAANSDSAFGTPGLATATPDDLDAYLQRLAREEFTDRDFSNAVA